MSSLVRSAVFFNKRKIDDCDDSNIEVKENMGAEHERLWSGIISRQKESVSYESWIKIVTNIIINSDRLFVFII